MSCDDEFKKDAATQMNAIRNSILALEEKVQVMKEQEEAAEIEREKTLQTDVELIKTLDRILELEKREKALGMYDDSDDDDDDDVIDWEKQLKFANSVVDGKVGSLPRLPQDFTPKGPIIPQASANDEPNTSDQLSKEEKDSHNETAARTADAIYRAEEDDPDEFISICPDDGVEEWNRQFVLGGPVTRSKAKQLNARGPKPGMATTSFRGDPVLQEATVLDADTKDTGEDMDDDDIEEWRHDGMPTESTMTISDVGEPCRCAYFVRCKIHPNF